MSFKVKMDYNDGSDYYLDEDFETEEEAEEAAMYAISCHHLGGELLEMMGGEEGEIDYSTPDYEIIEEE